MKTTLLRPDTPASFTEAVARAVALLRAGQVVALPTETVYGLAANALDAQAVLRVFEVKGRPAHNPVIVHVASIEMARRCVSNWPEIAQKLAVAFWPGPLTMVLPRAPEIPDIVTAGGRTVGVRWPSHSLVEEVIRSCGFPLAMPSANPASQISPTKASHVQKGLGGKIALIVDGGPAQVGIESTVVDLSQPSPQVLRPGMITLEALQRALGNNEAAWRAQDGRHPAAGENLRSPGQLPKHYSPKARLVVWDWRDEADLESQILNVKFEIAKTHVIAHRRVPSADRFGRVTVLPDNPEGFAQAFYAELHRCDEEGAELIVVERLPEARGWQAISDRLQRAASPA
jgi:L-threonylcarbamoyladenylate synthase